MENKLFSDCVCLNACPTTDFMGKHTLKLLSVFLQTYHYDIDMTRKAFMTEIELDTEETLSSISVRVAFFIY